MEFSASVNIKTGKREFIVRTFDLKNLAAAISFVLLGILANGGIANAQGNSRHEKQEQKRQQKMQKQLAKAEQERQAEWNRRNSRFERTRTIDSGYYSVDPDTNVAAGRYRINRNGRWYNTDNQGADLLKQAVNEGYRQGFAAGRADRNTRRRGTWSNNNVYRTGSYGYRNGVAQSQYQYYFRQGFQRGYQDGSNNQYRDYYYGDYQYGTNNGGSLNVLGTILNQILNIKSY
jgi:hypothetical protein